MVNPWVAALLGGGFLTLVGGLLNHFFGRGNLNADTAKKLVETSGSLVDQMQEERATYLLAHRELLEKLAGRDAKLAERDKAVDDLTSTVNHLDRVTTILVRALGRAVTVLESVGQDTTELRSALGEAEKEKGLHD